MGVGEGFVDRGEDDDADVASEEGEERVGLAEKTLAAHGEGDLKAALRLNRCNLLSSLLFSHHALPCSSSRSPQQCSHSSPCMLELYIKERNLDGMKSMCEGRR